MKRLFIFITLLSFLFITRVNASVLTLEQDYEIPPTTDIIEVNNNYIVAKNNLITKYDKEFNPLADKTFEELSDTDILEYNDQILLVANNNNFIKLYLLDTDLKVLSSKETTIYYHKINLYKYNSKIYLVLGDDYILEDTNMYEIDAELNIKENAISTYGDKLKDILKSDYYAFNNEDITNPITATAYNKDYIVLGGNDFIRVLNKKGEIIKEKEVERPVIDIIILNNKILLLSGQSLLEGTFDLDFEGIDAFFEVPLSELVQTKDKVIVRTSNYFGIFVYDYSIKITKVESNFGTLEVLDSVKPGAKVNFKATANSGYEIEKIIVTDEYGNEVKVKDNSFIAPSSDVTIEVLYAESVINPETLDIIYVIAIVAFITLLIYIRVSKKLNWINK